MEPMDHVDSSQDRMDLLKLITTEPVDDVDPSKADLDRLMWSLLRETDFNKLKTAKKTSGLTYTELADKMDVNKVWLASAFDHQQYVPKEYCVKLAEALGLKEEDTMFLSEFPYHNQQNVNPVFCRLPEVFETYEAAIKSIIYEQGGNAIMSSTGFNIDVNVTTDEEGNHHVRIELDERRFPNAKHNQKDVNSVFCRISEVFETYESAIKSIIQEQGGNAIMSSTGFNIDVNVTTDEEGNHHVRIELDERRFPHAKQGKYPWK